MWGADVPHTDTTPVPAPATDTTPAPSNASYPYGQGAPDAIAGVRSGDALFDNGDVADLGDLQALTADGNPRHATDAEKAGAAFLLSDAGKSALQELLHDGKNTFTMEELGNLSDKAGPTSSTAPPPTTTSAQALSGLLGGSAMWDSGDTADKNDVEAIANGTRKASAAEVAGAKWLTDPNNKRYLYDLTGADGAFSKDELASLRNKILSGPATAQALDDAAKVLNGNCSALFWGDDKANKQELLNLANGGTANK